MKASSLYILVQQSWRSQGIILPYTYTSEQRTIPPRRFDCYVHCTACSSKLVDYIKHGKKLNRKVITLVAASCRHNRAKPNCWPNCLKLLPVPRETIIVIRKPFIQAEIVKFFYTVTVIVKNNESRTNIGKDNPRLDVWFIFSRLLCAKRLKVSRI